MQCITRWNLFYPKNFRNVLLVNSGADHLKVGDFGLSKLIKVQSSHDVYKMTGETGSCEYEKFLQINKGKMHRHAMNFTLFWNIHLELA